MERIVGWRGVGIVLEGEREILDEVVAGLPDFFGGDLQPQVAGTVHVQADVLTLTLPDDLGVSGPMGVETLRAAASRIELCVVDRVPEHIAIHAGVVAVGDLAIVLPATSMAGKSTLVRALVDAGADYLSDEYALLTPDGRVRPYPRRMTIRTPTGSVRITPERPRSVQAEPVPVGVVALISYSTAGWSVAPLTPAAAVLAIVENGVNVRRYPEQAMSALAALAVSALTVRGTRGEAVDAAGSLIHLLGSRLL